MGILMGDKRHSQRQHVLKAGTISFDGSGIDCLVRNMSVGGANLEVESQIGIPSSFDLVINVERSNHHCHVVWRKARRIGIAFD
jgi:PilZ domain